ncbi:hypothetical protein ACOSQ2_014592 [Xanthoceras sorbifolium]
MTSLRPLAHRSSSRFSCSHAVRPRGSVDRASSRRFSRSSFCCPCVELQDWNNRRQFTPPSDFHADGVNEFFNSQAVTDGSRANEILKQAPFLVPFTSRVKIFHGEGNRKGPTSSSEEEGQQTPDPKPAPPCVAHVCRLLVAPLSCLTARVFCRQSV